MGTIGAGMIAGFAAAARAGAVGRVWASSGIAAQAADSESNRVRRIISGIGEKGDTGLCEKLRAVPADVEAVGHSGADNIAVRWGAAPAHSPDPAADHLATRSPR